MATILIVDDRPANREYLVALLGQQGHRLLEAPDGVVALQCARKDSPDLIITDILMPNLDGFALVRELRNDSRLTSTPVIFYTAAYLEIEARKLAQDCGVQQILIKPLEPEQVLSAVSAALQNPGSAAPSLTNSFMQEHLALLTNKLYQKVQELEASNIRLAQRTVELAQTNTNLQNLSLTDELTGLYNRRGFLQLATRQLKLAQRAQRRLCLLFIDIDNMKAINDRFGHQSGDTALIQVSEILRRSFRASDVISRIGGDEFAALAIDAAEETEQIVQTRLQSLLDIHNAAAHEHYQISLSLGAILIDGNTQHTIEELLTQADSIMYAQKHSKRQLRAATR